MTSSRWSAGPRPPWPWRYQAAFDAKHAEFDGELTAWIAPQITDDQPSFGSGSSRRPDRAEPLTQQHSSRPCWVPNRRVLLGTQQGCAPVRRWVAAVGVANRAVW